MLHLETRVGNKGTATAATQYTGLEIITTTCVVAEEYSYSNNTGSLKDTHLSEALPPSCYDCRVTSSC
jgi:hypothetical protein